MPCDPITNASGFMAEVRPELLDPHTERQVLGVLNAGSTISAVDYDEAAGRYLVRAELYEFLSIVAKRSFEADKANVDLAELEKIVGVALLPDINQNAETVLHYMHPIDEDRGFTAEINLAEVIEEHKRTVRSTLNAGATLGRVQRARQERQLLLHPPRPLQDAGAHPRPHADGRLRASAPRRRPGARRALRRLASPSKPRRSSTSRPRRRSTRRRPPRSAAGSSRSCSPP